MEYKKRKRQEKLRLQKPADCKRKKKQKKKKNHRFANTKPTGTGKKEQPLVRTRKGDLKNFEVEKKQGGGGVQKK